MEKENVFIDYAKKAGYTAFLQSGETLQANSLKSLFEIIDIETSNCYYTIQAMVSLIGDLKILSEIADVKYSQLRAYVLYNIFSSEENSQKITRTINQLGREILSETKTSFALSLCYNNQLLAEYGGFSRARISLFRKNNTFSPENEQRLRKALLNIGYIYLTAKMKKE